MELGEYPFSGRYGWTQDRYGLSWQVMFMGERAMKQRITPTLMFVGEECGKAEDAINFYTSVFRHAKVDHVLRYGKDEKPDKEGTIRHSGIVLADQSFAVMDSARAHGFTFKRSHFVYRALQHSRRNRLFLVEPFCGPQGRTMWVAERQVRPYLANCSCAYGPAAAG